MNRKRVELLAPAGNYESFLGVISAGADAVYIGGEKFGARAYAQNFSDEEVISAIRYAHLFGRRVYLTVNTLMKEEELQELYEYLLPFYECGLDAVIVQDMGVLRTVRQHFPDMALHISTQMTVTGAYGARLMKRWGASRIVPARELSLEEIRAVKREADIEVETFVHGALCYSYSGQCLFSSVLGGRSGNRGRCAQPCRLPYQTDSLYPLSLKDLCTVELIPRMIEAGIDSFKIEGRMKKAEYAAGVTHIYRKYIDLYEKAPQKPFAVAQEDLNFLRGLYVRSGLENGYYDRYNAKEMVTMTRPSYAGSDETVLQDIRSRFLTEPKRLGVQGRLVIEPGRPAVLTIRQAEGRESVRVEGAVAQPAQKRPLDRESVARQLGRTGNTPFYFAALDIELSDNAFLPLGAVNELRREALDRLYDVLSPCPQRRARQEADAAISQRRTAKPAPVSAGRRCGEAPSLFVSVRSPEQFFAVLETDAADGVCLPLDCLVQETDECRRGPDASGQRIARVREALAAVGRRRPPVCYLSMPYITRRQDSAYLEAAETLLKEPFVDGIMIRNPECYEWILEKNITKPLLLDANLYCFNSGAMNFLREDAAAHHRTLCMTLSQEADRKQLRALAAEDTQLVIYGRTNMMVSANCVRKTLEGCLAERGKSRGQDGGQPDFFALQDRCHKVFPVDTDCLHCTNIIYNSLPTSLHPELDKIRTWGLGGVRLQFTVETGEEAAQISDWFARLLQTGDAGQPPFAEFTRGHFKNGVE